MKINAKDILLTDSPPCLFVNTQCTVGLVNLASGSTRGDKAQAWYLRPQLYINISVLQGFLGSILVFTRTDTKDPTMFNS